MDQNYELITANRELRLEVEVLRNELLVQQRELTKAIKSIGELCALVASPKALEIVEGMIKANAVSQILGAAINNRGFDAKLFQSFATEVPHLVDMVMEKFKENTQAKYSGVNTDPELKDGESVAGFTQYTGES